MSEEITERRILKPKGYVSHMVVHDPNPKLIINLDYTMFQASKDLSQDEGIDFDVTEDGDYLVIKEKED